MAVPKRKTSKQRRNLRRSSHWKLNLPNLVLCPKCGEYALRHRVCKGCGTYGDRQVIAVESDKK